MKRRSFLGLLGGTALLWPKTLSAFAAEVEAGGGPDDEAYWAFVRDQFLIPRDRIYLNNGTLGPSPAVVVEAVAEHARRVASTYPPGVSWEDLKGSVGAFLNADPEGLVFPRNTTEAMSFVANGLEMSPGDEILTTDHEHIGGLCPWQLVSTRSGASLRTFSLPVPAVSREGLLETILGALSPETRVLSLSHVTFTTGTILPVEEVAELCRSRGIIFVVDGAQRLNHLGTFDETRMAGLLAAVEFLSTLGMERIEARVRHLRARLEDGIRSLPGVTVVTPEEEALKGGMISFALDGVDSLELQRQLGRVAKVRTRVIGEYDYGWMRLSTHLYNQPEEIDRTIELLGAAARGEGFQSSPSLGIHSE